MRAAGAPLHDDLTEWISQIQAEESARDAEDIRPPSYVQLGPLTMTIMEGSRWQWKDAFPSSQLFADEVEKILSYTLSQDRFEKYLPRLKGRARQRDASLAELRVAFFFHRNGFRVSQWEPIGAQNANGSDTAGEYLIRGPKKVDVFTEIKHRDWQSELGPEEIKAGRQYRPKYLSFEGRAVAQHQSIQAAIDKAYEKFSAQTPNLLIIYDDLFVGLQSGTDTFAHQALYEEYYAGSFKDLKYSKLGGVGIFSLIRASTPILQFNGEEHELIEYMMASFETETNESIEYGFNLYLNPTAVTPLPDDLAIGFHGYSPGRLPP
jgi:hypothetical protein